MTPTTNITLYLQELTGSHLRWDNLNGALHVGMEQGLILQLEDSIASSQGSNSGGSGTSKTTTPVDLGAVDLHTRISEDVNYFLPAWHKRDSLVNRVDRFGRDSTVTWTIREEQLGKWYRAIRQHLEPLPQRPLPGVSCPKCLESKLARLMDGERVFIPVITVYPRQLMATCTNCGESWYGQRDLETLARAQVARI